MEKKEIKILVVDDEENVGLGTKETCEDWGYNTFWVGNSEKAIELIKDININIIILDINLNEELTGLDLIPKFKAINPNIVIIMLTGRYEIENAIQAMQEGALDYILKPFEFDYLKHRINQAVDYFYLMQLKNIYLSALVHDLKNPLQNIFMLPDITMIQLKKNNFQGVNDLFDKIRYSAKKMESIIENILNLEKMNNQSYVVNKESLDFIGSTDHYIEKIRKFENIDIVIQYKDKESFPLIKLDTYLYYHVLENIIFNAKKYSIMDKSLEIDISLENKNLITKVKNFGSYINPEDQKVIFDLYKRLDSLTITETKPKGFGIGLSFCKLAVNCMGGEISVSSDKEENTTEFIFSIKI